MALLFILACVAFVPFVESNALPELPRKLDSISIKDLIRGVAKLDNHDIDQGEVDDPVKTCTAMACSEHRKDLYDLYLIWYGGSTGHCNFEEYAPLGPLGKVGNVKSPTLKLSDSVDTVLTTVGTAAKVAKLAKVGVKFAEKVVGKLPTLGPIVALFSLGLGEVYGGQQVTPQDLIDKTNKGLKDLAKEVNEKLGQVKDFSYYGDMKTHMHTVIDVYEELSKDWRGCIMEPTIEEVQKCEFLKLKSTLAKLDRFLHFKECVDSKNVKSQPCTRTHYRKYAKVTAAQKARWLELSLDVTRDYANLILLQSVSFVEFNCVTRTDLPLSLIYCNLMTDKISKIMGYLIKYVTNAVWYIKQMHLGEEGKGVCSDNFKCTRKKTTEHDNSVLTHNEWWSYTYDCDCHIDGVEEKMENTNCKVAFYMREGRRDGKNGASIPYFPHYIKNTIPWKGTADKMARSYGWKKLKIFAEEYERRQEKAMTEFWHRELLSFVPKWRKAIQLITCMTESAANLTRPIEESYGVNVTYGSLLGKARAIAEIKEVLKLNLNSLSKPELKTKVEEFQNALKEILADEEAEEIAGQEWQNNYVSNGPMEFPREIESANQECRPKEGGQCIFPFKFNGKTCPGPKCCNFDNDSTGSWCATRVDENGTLDGEHYGYCAGTPCEPDRQECRPKEGGQCIFPFKFDGKTCPGPKCCNFDNDLTGSWCATRVDENGTLDGAYYGYCAGTPCEPDQFTNNSNNNNHNNNNINECDNDNGGCEQTCVNKEDSSFECKCRSGFTLAADNKTCTELQTRASSKCIKTLTEAECEHASYANPKYHYVKKGSYSYLPAGCVVYASTSSPHFTSVYFNTAGGVCTSEVHCLCNRQRPDLQRRATTKCKKDATEAECQHAPYPGLQYKYQYSGSWSYLPKGCFVYSSPISPQLNQVFFNKIGGYCKDDELCLCTEAGEETPPLQIRASTRCLKDANETECERGPYPNKHYIYQYSGTWAHLPKGCFVYASPSSSSFNKVYFNKHFGGRECKKDELCLCNEAGEEEPSLQIRASTTCLKYATKAECEHGPYPDPRYNFKSSGSFGSSYPKGCYVDSSVTSKGFNSVYFNENGGDCKYWQLCLCTDAGVYRTGESNEKEIFGSWKVTFYSKKYWYSTYFIIKNGNDTKIRVHSCSWSGCKSIVETKVLPSTDYYYSHSNGWFEVRNIHSANLNLFLKRESKEKLLVVWYGPLSGYKVTASGVKEKGMRTIGGNAEGAFCHFPYWRKGSWHTTCIDREKYGGTGWCYIKRQSQFSPRSTWGKCIEVKKSCEIEDTEFYDEYTKRRDGSSLWKGWVSSWEDCGRKCNVVGYCGAWTYYNHQCQLKTVAVIGEERTLAGRISGFKNCPPAEKQCSFSTSKCGENQHCVDVGGSYKCDCNDGYVMSNKNGTSSCVPERMECKNYHTREQGKDRTQEQEQEKREEQEEMFRGFTLFGTRE